MLFYFAVKEKDGWNGLGATLDHGVTVGGQPLELFLQNLPLIPCRNLTVDHLIMQCTKSKYLIYFYYQTLRKLNQFEQDQSEHI